MANQPFVRRPRAGDERRGRLLIPDTSPLSLLALVGEAALDWLFVPGAEVWVTDMVREETLRDPDPDDDQRRQHRAVMRQWFDRNRHRIRIQETDAGSEYLKAMEAWELTGRVPRLKPSWRGRGDASVLQTLDAAARIVEDGSAVVAIVDDARARAAIRLARALDIDLMATESFIAWMADRFAVVGAETAWSAIELASGGHVPASLDDDPVYIRQKMP